VIDKFKKAILNKVAKTDPQPVGNIILNLCGCDFCKAFNADCNKKEKQTCTDFIDNFIKSQY
jgi:hypothetical protein